MIGFAFMLAAAITAPDAGPMPEWDQAIALGNKALAERLIDPESARVAWPWGFYPGSLKGFLAGRQSGWISCGQVNSKNRMGGYSGAVPFLIIIRNGQVASLDIGEPDGMDTASATCPDLIRKGLIRSSGAGADLLPISAFSADQAKAASAEDAAKQGGIGVSFTPSETGDLVLLAVAPESPAARAGLKPGDIMRRANGIDLRGMGLAAASALLQALPAQADLDLSDGRKIQIDRR